jgi:hypothetical protein
VFERAPLPEPVGPADETAQLQAIRPTRHASRRSVRVFRTVGVFVLVAGALGGTYLGLRGADQAPASLPLTLADGTPAPTPDPGADGLGADAAQAKAAAAAVAAAERVKQADDMAKRQDQQEKASRSEPRINYPVPESCKEFTGNRGIGCGLLLEAGYGLDQMPCLNKLWNKESNWRTKAANPSSGAYGIPQALPGKKMASVGSDWRTNPVTQIKWGLGYIKGRYNKPCNAWSHSQRVGWY